MKRTVKKRRCRWSTPLLAPVLLAAAGSMPGCVGLADERAEARAGRVDAMSGATLTRKAHLKAIELALEQAHG